MLKLYRDFDTRRRARAARTNAERIRALAPSATVRTCVPGDKSRRAKDKLCLFAHYEAGGRVDGYVMRQLEELIACGFDVVLISTNAVLDSRDLPRLRSLCRTVIHRQNVGLDFGSWAAAIALIEDLDRYEALLLANDSVFGPFAPLAPLLRAMDESAEAVCGLTDNWEKQYHLQSYFLYLKAAALRSQVFRDFWAGFQLSEDKGELVIRGEVGISQAFITADFKLRALFPFYEVRARALALGQQFQYWKMIRRQAFNPTIFAWDILIRDMGFPFLKTELLKSDRFHSHNTVYWRDLVRPEAADVVQLTSDFLKRGHWNCKG